MAEVFDFIYSFPAGMDSGSEPLTLPRYQLAFAFNGTMRGDFFATRPAFKTIQLNYAAPSVQTNLQTGLFQGAGYYKPDVGSESVVLAVAGRQFLVTPDNSGHAVVTEIILATDPNPPNQPQNWIRQAENFLIFNDGLSLPLFYDGATMRRSLGASQNLGTVNGAVIVPPIGSTVAVTLVAPYTGPLNESIFIGAATYVVTQVSGQSAAYNVTFRNLSDIAAAQPIDSQIISQPSNLGTVTLSNPGGLNQYILTTSSPGVLPPFVQVGGQIAFSASPAAPNFAGTVGTIIQLLPPIPGRAKTGIVVDVTPNLQPPLGCEATYITYSAPNKLEGVLAAAISVPAIDQTVTAFVENGFIGSIGDLVFIGSGHYSIENVVTVPPTSGLQITVENINDTANGVLTIPDQTILTTIPELPAGRTLTYGLGMVWECMIDAISFLAGDIVGGASGSPKYNSRDSVLKITENGFLAGGGLFRVPGTVGEIKAMEFIALLDASLGQGPLQVFTSTCVFGVAVPPNRAQWANVTNPIVTQSLLGAGGTSQDSVTLANGDIIFRAADGTLRSLLMARLDFNRWSNTPISYEMSRVIDAEDTTLLAASAGCVFDNRDLQLASFKQSPRGTYAASIIALNFDPISTLRGPQPSIYDGEWTGLNVLKLVSNFFNGVARCFAVCLGPDLSQIELHEILPTFGPTAAAFDDTATPIGSYLESPSLDFGDHKKGLRNYHRLSYGEIYVDGLVGPVRFDAFYKPDQWPNWVPWYSWTEPFDPNGDPGFRPRLGLPEPDGTVFDNVNNRPLREGFTFQFKLVMTGQGRFLGARFSADVIPQPEFAPPTVSP